MNILSWNCRGVAAAATLRELKSICRASQPAILFLLETRAHKERIDRVKRSLKFNHVFCVEASGLAGGLAIFWSAKVDIQICSASLNVIHTVVLDKEKNDTFDCSFIYGHPIARQRRNLWGAVSAFQLNPDRSWCAVGDFNEVLFQHEKEGLRPQNQRGMEDFRNFLNSTGLMDLELKGSKFTWVSNPRRGFVTRERLDRALVNWPLRGLYPNALAEALPILSSDHAPIVLHLNPKGKSGSFFKYEAHWEDHQDCKEVVNQGWLGDMHGQEEWSSLLNRTKNCKKHLLLWHKRTFKKAADEIERLKRIIAVQMEKHQSEIDWEEIKLLQNMIDKLWQQEETFWGQRSRLKWLQWGDRNTRFFHATTIQRRGRNRILKIQDGEGRWVEGLDSIFITIQDHFRNVYTSENASNNFDCLHVLPQVVQPFMNDRLLDLVSDGEIKTAVDSLGATKAPGPDGLNGLFYQKNWETVGRAVCEAIHRFFREGVIPKELNETVVTLIPKVPLPESINQLRPISYYNFIYKIISKIMVMRLKPFMGNLISANQSAFVGGRLIQDNLIVAQEVFHALKGRERGGKVNMALKLDMNKAYDRLEWNFLKEALTRYGFSSIWINWIMGLVTSVSYKYKINSTLSQEVIPQRGLRQGDPLSPYLFILVADALSYMLKEALSSNRIQGIKLAPGAPTLTHLFFADDAVLFARAKEEEAFQIINILNRYSKASGQRINTAKSGIIFGKYISANLKVSISRVLGIQQWDNPGKYLGLPADWGRAKNRALGWIREKILEKIEGWKESLLNQAGKETLIKAVLQAIPTYAMAVIRFPLNFCNKICSDIANFWWNSGGRRRGIHWKSWKFLSKKKKDGGLGFKDFKLMNSAHLAKQAWRAIHNPDMLWV